MKIAKVRLSNILGIEELEFAAGQKTTISGANGQGKTSIIQALIGALGSGSQAKLLRNGADEGEIVIVFDSGDKLRAKVTPERGVVRTGWRPDGTEIPKLQTWLKERFDAVAFSPVKFLRGTPEERLDWLFSISPLHLTGTQLTEAAPMADVAPGAIRDGEVADPLRTIEAVDKQLRDRRTVLNREAKKKKILVDELKSTLPTETGISIEEALAGSKRELKEVQAQLDGFLRAVESAKIESIAKIRDDRDVELDHKRMLAQAEIDAIKSKLANDESDIRAAAETKEDEVRKEATFTATMKQGELEPLETRWAGDVARLGEQAKQEQKAETTRALVKSASAEYEVQERDAKALTKALDRLEKLRLDLFGSLPIVGLEVTPTGQLLVEGVDYDTLNGANQVRVAFQLAKAASPNGICCLDGALAELDPKHRQFFDEWAEKSGLQFFLTALPEDEKPLTIEAVR